MNRDHKEISEAVKASAVAVIASAVIFVLAYEFARLTKKVSA